MKSIFIVSVSVLLAACEPSGKSVDFPVRPEEFKDCKFAYLTNSQGTGITVARCPNSTTTTMQSDKAKTTTVVIDGVEYIKKE
jgi:hypothetical protein